MEAPVPLEEVAPPNSPAVVEAAVHPQPTMTIQASKKEQQTGGSPR